MASKSTTTMRITQRRSSATLAAARQRYPDRRIWAVFQPHTFSRTERMLYRMGESFGDADEVIVTDIFAAREANDDRRVVCRTGGGQSASRRYAISANWKTLHAIYRAHIETGDMVITLGAGDVNKIGKLLLRQETVVE